MINGKPVVLFVEHHRENGCNYYRLRQPAWKIQALDLFPCALSRDLSDEDFEVWLDKADVIFTKTASPKFRDWMATRPSHKKVIFDLDDDIFSVDVYIDGAWAVLHRTDDEQEARLRASLEASNDRRVYRVKSPDGRSVLTRRMT